jgi:predicted permease
MRQLLTETLALGVIGGGIGWFLAQTLVAGISRWRPVLPIPMQLSVDLSWRVFAAALAATLLAAFGSGLLPARLAIGVDLNRAIKSGTGAPRASRRWSLREGLLAVQVALAAALVTACLASIQGLTRALAIPSPSTDPGVAAVKFDLALTRMTPERGAVFQRHVVEAVARLPSVDLVGLGNSIPLHLDQWHNTVFPIDAVDFGQSAGIAANDFRISPHYLDALRIPLVAGRGFTWHDNAEAPRVAIVNRRFAELALKPGDPIGQRFRYAEKSPPVEVVGLIENFPLESLTEPPRAAIFRPLGQAPTSGTVAVARTTGSAQAVAGEIRRAIRAIDPSVPVFEVGAAKDLVRMVFLPARIATVTLSAFGLLAIMLAVTGVNGMAAYVVTQGTRDAGIRMALGAQPGALVRSLFGRLALIVGTAAASGLVLAVAASRLIRNVVPQGSPNDPMILVTSAGAIALLGLAAAAAPARRAVAIDPLSAVRGD